MPSETMKFRELATKVNRFPADLNNHMMTFSFEKFSRTTAATNAKISKQNTLALPIPSNLTELVSLSWSDGDSWSVAGDDVAAFIAGGASREDIIARFGDRFKNTAFAEIVESKLKQIGSRVKLSLPGIGAAVSSFSGETINPNIALVFKGQNGTREHSFSWKLVPENVQESEILRDMIREFRFQALPNKQSAFLMDAPNQVKIQIFGSELGFLPFYKTCVITQVEVNYAPEGVPTFMRATGAPAAVTLSLSFKETNQLFKEDVARLDPEAAGKRLLTFNETDIRIPNKEKRSET